MEGAEGLGVLGGVEGAVALGASSAAVGGAPDVGLIGGERFLGGQRAVGAEMDAEGGPKHRPKIKGLKYRTRAGKIEYVPWWGIIILVIIFVILVGFFIFAILNQGAPTSTILAIRDSYILVWGDDFQEGTAGLNKKYSCNITVDGQSLPFSLGSRRSSSARRGVITVSDRNQPTKRIDYPDLERWTLQQSSDQPVVYFSDELANCFIKNGLLHMNMLRRPVTIRQGNLIYNYNITSCRIISRVALQNGFFNFRLKLPRTATLKVSLLPYYNVAMNKIGSIYGKWAACGEIVILDYSPADSIWRGYLAFGGEYPEQVFYPADDCIAQLDKDQWQIIGLEWRNDKISWIYDSCIDNGGNIYGGKVLQSVSSDKWFSLVTNCNCDHELDWIENKNLNNLNERYNHGKQRNKIGCDKCQKIIPPPAPFDQLFHLVMELTTTTDRLILPDTSLIDWVKIYQHPEV